MKKFWIVCMAVLLSVSFWTLSSKEAKAEESVAAESLQKPHVTPIALGHYEIDEALKDAYNKKVSVTLTSKTVNVWRNDFNSMLSKRTYKNVYSPSITWQPIITDKGKASSYRVTITVINQDGTSSETSYDGVTVTSFSPSISMYEGKTYKISIAPTVEGVYKTKAGIKTTLTILPEQKPVSDMLFKLTIGEQKKVSSQTDAIFLNSIHSNTESTNDSYHSAVKDENAIPSFDAMNHSDKTTQLFMTTMN